MSLRSVLLPVALAGAVGVPGAACAATAIDLRSDGIELAVQTTAVRPDAPVIGSQADLSATPIDNLKTELRLGAEAGAKSPDETFQPSWIALPVAGRWKTGHVGLGAHWSPSPLAQLEVTADSQVRHDIDRATSTWAASTDQQVLDRLSAARVAATLLPASPLNLRIGGEALDHSIQTASAPLAGQAGAYDTLRTRTERAFSALQWRPLPMVSLEGGGQLEALGVAWDGSGARAGSFAYVEPRVAGSMTPWDGAVWRLAVERAVSPVRTDQFLSFAQVAAPTAGPSFEPDQEWRYQASLQQHLGEGVDLTAAYTWARLQTVTDLGPVGATQAPMDIGTGQRDQVEAAVTAPLKVPGLPAFTVKARAAVRRSQVADPFTGAARRLSGEAPYDAQLSLGPQAPGAALRWGLNASATGAATTFQMSQTSTQSASAGLGGFVAYNPGPLSIELRLDNAVGGGRTQRDVYFTGSRDLGLIDRIAESRNANRVLRISLSKAL